ncbi:MAG: dihydrolipoyl dehydrogenase [Verrucomicrobia bacterium]|nr:dihydrolipoyl dehydrogenase [Verrucomicrobiota bacterium]
MEPIQTELVVLGAGPGGYTAAFYAADRGKQTILVERADRLGGVCLNHGCIPSKALLHAAETLFLAKEAARWGLEFGAPKVRLEKLREWKESILEKLGQGVAQLARRRKVTVLRGRGRFEDSNTLRVETDQGQQFIRFQKAIVAAGSVPAMPKAFDLDNPRVMTSTEALQLPEAPCKLLVIGAGYIGMELGAVYAALGSEVTVVEALPRALAAADPDLARPVLQRARQIFKEIRTGTKVVEMAAQGPQIRAVTEKDGVKREELYDRALVAVGRKPRIEDLGLENTKVSLDEKGFIKVDERRRTADPNLYAIGDIVGGALLAHKASREARVAVEDICGEPATAKDFILPAVVFTDPEIAWCGLTESEAREKQIPVEVAKFPWAASGRALTLDRPDGMTKLIIDPETERILGVGIVGRGAGELISEGVLAIEMGATARDLALSTHPHPTLSETLMECAELYYGYATHAVVRKRRKENRSR